MSFHGIRSSCRRWRDRISIGGVDGVVNLAIDCVFRHRHDHPLFRFHIRLAGDSDFRVIDQCASQTTGKIVNHFDKAPVDGLSEPGL